MTPARMRVVGLATADGAAEQVRERDSERRADECSGRAEVEASVAAEVVSDHERGAEPGARRRAEEVRIGQGIAEDTLIARSRGGEHGPDEETEDDARSTKLPQDRVLRVRERRVDAEEGDVAQHLADDRHDPEVDGPEREPQQRRHDDEGAGGESPAERDSAERRLRPGREARSETAGAAHSGCPIPSRASAIRATKSTVRGPQREAMSSSASTTSPLATAST